MSRPCRAPALAVVLLAVSATAGCQNYNFNPVGHCLLQPGLQTFTLSNISTADVLFVVDDSGSMGGEQDRLAAAFSAFVTNLSNTNTARLAAGLEPLDFHVAVTTTSIFANPQTTQVCRSDCTGAAGQLVCCNGTSPVHQPRRCTANSQCAGLGTDGVCRTTCNGLKGEGYCCDAGGGFPPSAIVDPVPCAREGINCGMLQTHYAFSGTSCEGVTDRNVIGVGADEWPYPQGEFVSSTSGSAANPRVLHFDKRLYTSADHRNAQGFTRAQLEAFFQQNIKVGVCGSQEEQGLQAARLALETALGPNHQKDTYTYDWAASLTSTSTTGTTLSWNASTRTATADAVWPSPIANSKLVLVFVGDEDDCSSPRDPSGGVVLVPNEGPGADACTRDSAPGAVAPLGLKEFAVSSLVDYYASRGRPLGAAFIVSARSSGSDSSCSGDQCYAAVCCDYACTAASGYLPNTCAAGDCGGQGPGVRFVDAAGQIAGRGDDTVVGSICDPNFGSLLDEIANIVKPPETLALPSVPAESRISVLRIVGTDGATRKFCDPPLAPKTPNYTLDEARNTAEDWWFVPGSDPAPPAWDPTAAASSVPFPTSSIYINPMGSCVLNPGETWSMEYLGVMPAGGCVDAIECADKLGGRPQDWECFVPPGLPKGTCTCSGT